MNQASNDKITRFIRHHSHYKNNRIYPDAFIPKNDSVDASVYVIEGLIQDKIWDIARNYLTTPIVARADITVNSIHISGLCIILNEPPPRHANITPFPELPDPACPRNEINLTSKKARRVLANKLANKSTLVTAPTKINPLHKLKTITD